MNDLISRQDAIKVIDRERKKKHLFNTAEDGLLEARGIINTLPSTPDTNQHVQHVLCVDLISRQDAVNEIHKYFVEEIEKTPTEIDDDGDELYADMPTVNSLLACNKELSKRIKSLPSAPDSRQRGEWIFEPKDAIELMFTLPKCSECGFESSDGGNFCSNCGARMYKGGEDNEKI